MSKQLRVWLIQIIGIIRARTSLHRSLKHSVLVFKHQAGLTIPQLLRFGADRQKPGFTIQEGDGG